MLKHLRIQNIILVENAFLSFSTGLNVLTGETGSGKSAIMHGLSLAIGERADSSLVRRGCEKGIVEAVFEEERPFLQQLLEEGGIDHEKGQDLIIRREITSNGKARVFINNQLAQLAFLRKLGIQLVQVVGQHANLRLLNLDYHRQVLDLYGDLNSTLCHFRQKYEQELILRQQLDELKQQEAQRIREMDSCQRELEELQEAHLKEQEDEELFAEYTLLAHADELATKIHDINQALTGERQPLITLLNRHKQALESLVQYDLQLKESAESFQNALLELQEVSHTLRHYGSRLPNNPERLQEINERLSLLNRLKRKYGSTVEEMLTYQTQTMLKLNKLEQADLEIEQMEEDLQKIRQQTDQLAHELSHQRQAVADQLAQALTHQLHALNMSKAELRVEVSAQKRTKEGDDRIEFFLCPNVGERYISLKEHASGGEISRVLLALQTLLAGKEQIATLIFDEVDANIGGETATIVGDKLRKISQQHQVICITHFPQVAQQANHHLQISKQEKEGRTLTLVDELTSESRPHELARMAGFKMIHKKLTGSKAVIRTE
jgi:DNA repair protein RecN (Recombination protein N)